MCFACVNFQCSEIDSESALAPQARHHCNSSVDRPARRSSSGEAAARRGAERTQKYVSTAGARQTKHRGDLRAGLPAFGFDVVDMGMLTLANGRHDLADVDAVLYDRVARIHVPQ